MLPLDVQNTRENTNFEMYMMWYIVIMSALFYLTVVLPFGLFYSETDEEKEFVSICTTLIKMLTLIVLLGRNGAFVLHSKTKSSFWYYYRL